jgi:ribonuclease BN (tRNA processing enzyme)
MTRCMMICLFALLSIPTGASAQSCSGNPVAVQILGSGGPAMNRERASASYVLWVGPEAKMLVDMGGGTYLRFSQSQAKLADLAMMAISHLHPDHVSDLPALLWLSHQARKDPLPISGPSGNEIAPAFPAFLRRLFDEKTGAFQVLGHTMGAAQGNGVPLEISVVDVTKAEPTKVLDKDGFTVTAFGIPHANVPTLAYRVQTRGASVVFSSDQNGTNPKFVDFAKGADLLVMHLAIAAGATSPLHAAPAVVGRIAQEAGVKRLIVSHIGLFDLDAAIVDVKKSYSGPLTVGADLQCTPAQ